MIKIKTTITITILMLILQSNVLFANEYIFKLTEMNNLKQIKNENIIDGLCGISNNTLSENIPSNLCISGTPSQVNLTESTYNWSCNGSVETETNKAGKSVNCSAVKLENKKWSDFNVFVSRDYYVFGSIKARSEDYNPSINNCKNVGDGYGSLCTTENNGNLELTLKMLQYGCFNGNVDDFDGFVMHNITGVKNYQRIEGNQNVNIVISNDKVGFNLSSHGCFVKDEIIKLKLIF